MAEDQNNSSEDFAISIEMIEAASRLLDLDFTAEEIQQMHKAINDSQDRYKHLRGANIPNDLPPALQFNPLLVLENQASIPRLERSIRLTDTPKVQRPDDLEDIAFWPVTKLASLIQSRQVSAVELTTMYLERLKRYNPYLEAVVTFTEDLAMKQARHADAELSSGKYRGLLHGIPWGAKDLLAVGGYPTTWGAAPYKHQMIQDNATVYERLSEAGAVLIAKLTLGALAYGDVWFGGKTRNPWDISQGSSGSSAGPGAAVAAGLVGFAIGSETLGSIVSPSTQCGVTGLRPTFGRVSRHGAMALSWSMDKLGPMARSVEDCALIFNVIYGADPKDGHVLREQPRFKWPPQHALSRLRVGYVKSAFEDEENSSPNDSVVLDTMRGLGVELIAIDMPKIDTQSLMLILTAEAAAAFDEITRHNLDDQLIRQDKDAWPNTFRKARFIPAVEYIQANRLRTQLCRDMATIMTDIDVFITPSFGGNVLHITNLTGHPAVVVPNGFNEKGTPTSISFVGGLFKETETLQVAQAFQDATRFHTAYPPLDFVD